MGPVIRAAVILALLCLLAAGSQAASHYNAPYVVPPSAIHAITGVSPAVSAPLRRLADDQDFGGHLADESRFRRGLQPGIAPGETSATIIPITTPPGEQQPFNFPENVGRVRSLSPSAVASPAPPRSSPVVAARHSLADLVFVGVASHYSAAYSEAWVAIPKGPGWRIRVCGPGTCRELVTTDTGPAIPGRVVDLPYHAWEAICGLSASYGLCDVSVVVEGQR